jgi:hypothetical protein
MMKWHVYYDDDYYDNGGVGFEVFDECDLAIKFIEDRIKHGENRKIENYKLILGQEKKLNVVGVVSKIGIGKGNA